MNWKKMVLAGTLVLACAGVGLSALKGSVVSAVSFDQVPKRKERLEVYGKLDKNSIRSLRGANLVAFDLVEEQTGRRLSVLYDNPGSALQANFPAASHARAAGIYDPTQKTFVADRVLTKCPSKYKEENLDLVTKNALDRWRSSTSPNASGS